MADGSMAFAEWVKQAGGEVFLRSLVEEVMARLMDYEVSGIAAAGGWSAAASGRPGATAIGSARSTPGWADWTCASPSFVAAATSRPSWSREGSRRRPLRRWCRKLGSAACPRARWTLGCRPWEGPAKAKSQVSALCQEMDERVNSLPPPPHRGRVAFPVAGCDLPEGATGRAGGVGGSHHRLRGQHRRAQGNPGAGGGRIGSPCVLGQVSAWPETAGADRRESGPLGRPRRVEGRDCPVVLCRPGSAAGCTS